MDRDRISSNHGTRTCLARILGPGGTRQDLRRRLPVAKWNAQWMQNPTSEEGAIIKREWWRKWKSEHIPPLHHVIQSYDTAYMKKETADYSAITTWGVFFPTEDAGANLILLDAIKGRYEFPELRRKALENYKYWQPESVLIEAKAAGLPLTYELRKMDIPVVTFTPSKGNDKHVRVNSVAPLFESGMIWAPDYQFAQEVIRGMRSLSLRRPRRFGRYDNSGSDALQTGWFCRPSRRLRRAQA